MGNIKCVCVVLLVLSYAIVTQLCDGHSWPCERQHHATLASTRPGEWPA